MALSRRLAHLAEEQCAGDPSHQHHTHDDDLADIVADVNAEEVTIHLPASIWYEMLDPAATSRAAENGYPEPTRRTTRERIYDVDRLTALELVRAVAAHGSYLVSDPNGTAQGRRFWRWAEATASEIGGRLIDRGGQGVFIELDDEALTWSDARSWRELRAAIA